MEETPQLQWLLVSEVDPPKTPVRSDPGSEIEGLKGSLEHHGQLSPILVRPKSDGRFELVYGHRRWLAHQAAGRKLILASVRELTDGEAARLRVVENQHRKAFGDLEVIQCMQALREQHGCSLAEIAELVNLSISSVSEGLSVLTLPEPILRSYSTDADCPYGIKHLIALAKLCPGKMEELGWLADKISRCKLTKEETGHLVKFIRSGQYAKLPDQVRALLFASPYMTAKHAELLAGPTEEVPDGDQQAVGHLTDADRVRLAQEVCEERLSAAELSARIEGLLSPCALPPAIGGSAGRGDGAGALRRCTAQQRRESASPVLRLAMGAVEVLKRLIGSLPEFKELLHQPEGSPAALQKDLRDCLRTLLTELDALDGTAGDPCDTRPSVGVPDQQGEPETNGNEEEPQAPASGALAEQLARVEAEDHVVPLAEIATDADGSPRE